MKGEIEYHYSQSFRLRLISSIGQRLLIVIVLGILLGFLGVPSWIFNLVLPLLASALLIKAVSDTKWNIEYLKIDCFNIEIRATRYGKIFVDKKVRPENLKVIIKTIPTGRGAVHQLVVSIVGFPKIIQLTDKYWRKDKFDKIILAIETR